MKILEIGTDKNGRSSGGRKELGAAEKWLFDTEDGEIRIKSLLNMNVGQEGIAELDEFKTYGSQAGTSNGLAISLNKVFLLGKIPLVAKGRKDRIAIIKVEKFKQDLYGKADKRPMGSNHIETVMSKLDEILKEEEKTK